MKRLPKKYKGLCCSLLAALFFSGMTACVRLSGDLPTMQKVLFRNLPALIITSSVMLSKHISFRPAPGNGWSMFGRVAAGTTGLILNFYAIDRLVLADANMLNKLSPFFSVIFSFFLLKEKVKPAQAAGVIAAFLGALLIIRPSGGAAAFPAVCGVLGGLGAGIAYTFVRKMGKNGELGIRIVFYFSFFSCLVSLPFFFIGGVAMTPRQWLVLLGAGLFGAAAQFAVTAAYFYAPARELSVYDYTQVLFATVWGKLLFDQTPDWMSFLGYAVIIGAAAVMFLYNNNLGPFRKNETAP